MTAHASNPWTIDKANKWYQAHRWLVGSNYVPANSINQIEMWQSDTFDAKQIDKELGWAQSAGMNTMRVFLHDLVWQNDPEGYKSRINEFLTIAAKHKIAPLFVLFDSCWDPHPHLGPQHPPIPGVHNSGWVQGPGADALQSTSEHERLKEYTSGVVSAFANDDRILGWDVWNEPNNTNANSYGKMEPKNKQELVAKLLLRVFEWVRVANPTQPITSGLWDGDWSAPDKLTPIQRIQIENSDIISFHNYGWPEDFEKHITWLEQFHRPLICTEFMARSAGSTFDLSLPIAKKKNVGMINWGLVVGKTQTNLPWDSWRRPYVLEQPPVWFHEVFYPDGKPYRQREIDLIRELTGN